MLDLGAGKGWSAKQLALRGCEVVAVEITDDELVGIGRGRHLMDHANTYFERVIADAEALPIVDDAFDAVFVNAALHHTNDLDAVLDHVARVLRPRGQLIVAAEPVRRLGDDEQVVLDEIADDEIRFGITERRPTILEYLETMRRHGLRPTYLESLAYRRDPKVDLRERARGDGLWPTVQLRHPRSSVRGLARWLGRIVRQPVSYFRALALMTAIESGPGFRGANMLAWSVGDFTLIARPGELADRAPTEQPVLVSVPRYDELVRSADLSDEQFVRLAYEVLLDREADAGGLQYWLDCLAEETFDREEVVGLLMQSTEFYRRRPGLRLLASAHTEFVNGLVPTTTVLDLTNETDVELALREAHRSLNADGVLAVVAVNAAHRYDGFGRHHDDWCELLSRAGFKVDETVGLGHVDAVRKRNEAPPVGPVPSGLNDEPARSYLLGYVCQKLA